jgi:hypothetical protein
MDSDYVQNTAEKVCRSHVLELKKRTRGPSYVWQTNHWVFFLDHGTGYYCARRDDDVHQRMNANGLTPYDLFS